MRFSTVFTALFNPYITHERIAQNLDFVSSLIAFFLIECHCSQNQGSLKSEERFQRAMYPALHIPPLLPTYGTLLCLYNSALHGPCTHTNYLTAMVGNVQENCLLVPFSVMGNGYLEDHDEGVVHI